MPWRLKNTWKNIKMVIHGSTISKLPTEFTYSICWRHLTAATTVYNCPRATLRTLPCVLHPRVCWALKNITEIFNLFLNVDVNLAIELSHHQLTSVHFYPENSRIPFIFTQRMHMK